MSQPPGIAALLAALESRGIILFLAEGEMRYRSPRDALTEQDRAVLRARKAEIMPYLRAREAGMALRNIPLGNIQGEAGPLAPSVTQEMWWRFAGGAQEGAPVSLNIAMIGRFAQTEATALEAAVRQVVARHDILRQRIRMQDGQMAVTLNPAADFVFEQAEAESADAAQAAATAFCAGFIPIQGDWLFRARLFRLPGGDMLAALVASHVIADAATRNIILAEIETILAGGQPAPVLSYADHALAERRFLAGAQGRALIDYWRDWYEAQPVMLAPQTGTPLWWGHGRRQLHNFTIPGRVLRQVERRAAALGATPFEIFLTIFALTMARWSGMARFPLRVLGDKRTSAALAGMVGPMFCADAIAIALDEGASFEAVLRAIRAEYDGAYSRRIPSLHFWAPQCVQPGEEIEDFPNKIPAVFNYYKAGIARERAGADTTADLPWPPQLQRMPLQVWPRRSSPLFLHLMDVGPKCLGSFHFYAEVITDAEQEVFLALFFEIFADTVAA